MIVLAPVVYYSGAPLKHQNNKLKCKNIFYIYHDMFQMLTSRSTEHSSVHRKHGQAKNEKMLLVQQGWTIKQRNGHDCFS